MPARFGATDTPSCPACKNTMHLTRRTPHPKYGYDFERQTFTCRVCKHEIQRDADCLGEVTVTPEKRPATRWPFYTISSDEDDERLDRALRDMAREDQRINDFTKRLDQVIEDAVRNG